MSSKRFIYVVGNSVGYMNWMQGQLISSLEDADLICFTGGEDVDPSFYNEPKHPTTFCNSIRDSYEKDTFEKALLLNKPMIGICRGSQFLCVMNGGKLVQNQENKFSSHYLKTFDNKIIQITSTHHQAAYPWNLKEGEDFKLLGWTKKLSCFHHNGDNKEIVNNVVRDSIECENVFYPKTKCLGIQGHPEWMKSNSFDVKYLQKMLNKFLANELK